MENNFFFQATIYLISAVIMVPIAKKLGLGSVLGYLIAGIIIGPFVLGFIGKEGEDIMHFAEFGVVMMLFLVGLELEPSLLWRLRAPILGLGGLQVILTAAVIFGISMIFGIPWQQGLALGFIVAMSSTAIVLQTLNEKGLMKTAAGQSSFSVLLFQDIAVIPILALLPLLATLKPAGHGEGHGTTLIEGLPSWLQPIAVLLAVGMVIVAGLYIVKPLLRYVARTRLRELFTATALLIVVSITVLMIAVGLSPALGTFLAGVILANSEYRHELESDIDPFKGLLLGLFFISVGASINFGLIAKDPLLILGLVFGIMFIKALVLFILGKAFKLSTDQNFLFALGLCQIGEFAFVLLSFTLQEGVLPNETVGLMMAVVAITMGLTPLIMLLNEKLIQPNFGTKQVTEKEADEIDEKHSVIIAGFGHFGGTIGRFLRANGVEATILDIDSDRVDTLRKMGLKVFYGDASRYDLLKVAGAEEAKILILAIDDPEKNKELVHTIKKHFPHLKILARARNRYDAYELLDEGIKHIYRESLDTSIRLGIDALRMLGYRAHRVHRAAKTFFKMDEKHVEELAVVRNDQKVYINYARQRIEELEDIIKSDSMIPPLDRDSGWDNSSLIEEIKSNNSQFRKE